MPDRKFNGPGVKLLVPRSRTDLPGVKSLARPIRLEVNLGNYDDGPNEVANFGSCLNVATA